MSVKYSRFQWMTNSSIVSAIVKNALDFPLIASLLAEICTYLSLRALVWPKSTIPSRGIVL